MSGLRRQHLMIVPKLQGPLILRVMLYWAVCLMSMFLAGVCWNGFAEPSLPWTESIEQVLKNCTPGILASVIFLPLVIVDIVRISNRIFGPMCRVQAQLEKLADGDQFRLLSVRESDSCANLIRAYNRVIKQISGQGRIPTEDVSDTDEYGDTPGKPSSLAAPATTSLRSGT